jgi:ribosomal protein L11 methylase PrmA
MTEIVPEAGSYRDPSGHVYDVDRRVLRTITDHHAADYEALKEKGLYRRFADEGLIVGAQEVPATVLPVSDSRVRYVVEHPRLPFVSYPYEWPFPALKAAALFHLDLHLKALGQGATLSDASAYNIQFQGVAPVFIDLLSFRRYRDGEFWSAHRQFCEQFLNPLLLRALVGIPHNAWYRGNLEGIPTADLARILPLRRKLGWGVLSHVVLQARLQKASRDWGPEALKRTSQRKLPLQGLIGMLQQLRRWIAKLEPADTGRTVWGDYAETHTYRSDEQESKREFVRRFVDKTRPKLLFDIGCNTGDYSALALEAGAQTVIGFDFDQQALERSFARAAGGRLAFTPLFLDAANPSPDQGWRQSERRGMRGRAAPDAVVALAFEHHLAIGRNVPIPQVVEWIVGLAPTGVVEFVQKDDPTVQRMLALRQDVFSAYGEAAFTAALNRHARIVEAKTVSAAGRKLFWYER